MLDRSLRIITVGSLALLHATASGQELLYENGPIITHPGDGPEGSDYSAIQTEIGQQASSYVIRGQVGDRMADEFVVPDGQTWQVESASIYTIVSDNPDLLQFMGIQIWDGPPNVQGSSVIWGDIDKNVLLENSFSGVYRGNDIQPRIIQQPITKTIGAVSAVLVPGTYWIDFSIDTSQFESPPTVIPVNILGEPGKPDANAVWRRQGSWSPLIDLNLDLGSVPQDIAFEFKGTILPASITDAVVPAGARNRDAGWVNFYGFGSSESNIRRYQQIYDERDLADLVGTYLTSVAFRVDGGQLSIRGGIHSFPELIIQLSTTHKEVDNLSENMNENLGNDLTTVYNGEYILPELQGLQIPNPFDYVIEFQEPFFYTGGNLILDVPLRQTFEPDLAVPLDAAFTNRDTVSRAYIRNRTVFTDTFGLVTKFSSMDNPCPADLTGDGMLDFFDVSSFLNNFGNQEPSADFTNDRLYDFFDVSAFLDAFGDGCP